MSKRVLILLLFFLFLSGCDNTSSNNNNFITNKVFPEEFNNILSNDEVIITSLGQSIDIENILIRLEHYEINNYRQENILDIDQIKENDLIIIVAGCSAKGLGDAGTNVASEIERARQLGNFKDKKNLTIIVFHIGGTSRRGATSDKLIEEAFKISDLVIYLNTGNPDGYFSSLFDKYKLNHVEYSNIGKMDEALLFLFGKEN